MSGCSNGTEAGGERKTTLIARIDKRIIPALDRVANTNQVNTAQLMSQFLGDIADAWEFLCVAQGGSFHTVEEWFAGRIIERCPGATPEALQAVGRIWHRAAELKAQGRGVKG